MLAPELQAHTPAVWVHTALSDLDALLIDHAHCEKKAAASAMALVNAYPEDSTAVRRLVRLAREELRHFEQVHKLIQARGKVLGHDLGDPYVQRLLTQVRKQPKDARKIDRLLVCALIEARSCERLALIGQHVPEPQLAHFYQALAKSEAGHYRLFVELAVQQAGDAAARARLAQLAAFEAQTMLCISSQRGVCPAVHG